MFDVVSLQIRNAVRYGLTKRNDVFVSNGTLVVYCLLIFISFCVINMVNTLLLEGFLFLIYEFVFDLMNFCNETSNT